MRKKLLKGKLLLTFLLLLILSVGCTPTETEIKVYTTEEIDAKINSLQEQITELDTKLSNIEANQLSSTDMINLFEIKKSDDDISDVVSGCPSRNDVEYWSEQYADDEISLSKLNKLLKKFNECN